LLSANCTARRHAEHAERPQLPTFCSNGTVARAARSAKSEDRARRRVKHGDAAIATIHPRHHPQPLPRALITEEIAMTTGGALTTLDLRCHIVIVVQMKKNIFFAMEEMRVKV